MIMAKFRIISEVKQTVKEDNYLQDHEEISCRLSHGLYDFLHFDKMPTEIHLLIGTKGLAFMKLWKLRKRKKEIYSFGMLDV